MSEKKTGDAPAVDFSTLVITLTSSAWMGLGKIADPVSGETKKDLAGARYTIEILLMLRDKTKGNLDKDELRLLDGVIADLQANYAETVFAEGAAATPEPAPTPPKDPPHERPKEG